MTPGLREESPVEAVSDRLCSAPRSRRLPSAWWPRMGSPCTTTWRCQTQASTCAAPRPPTAASPGAGGSSTASWRTDPSLTAHHRARGPAPLHSARAGLPPRRQATGISVGGWQPGCSPSSPVPLRTTGPVTGWACFWHQDPPRGRPRRSTQAEPGVSQQPRWHQGSRSRCPGPCQATEQGRPYLWLSFSAQTQCWVKGLRARAGPMGRRHPSDRGAQTPRRQLPGPSPALATGHCRCTLHSDDLKALSQSPSRRAQGGSV